MFKSTKNIKDFIIWCKVNKIKNFSYEGMSFELSDIAFIEELNQTDIAETAQETAEESNFDKAAQDKEDEDLLFYSVTE